MEVVLPIAGLLIILLGAYLYRLSRNTLRLQGTVLEVLPASGAERPGALKTFVDRAKALYPTLQLDSDDLADELHDEPEETFYIVSYVVGDVTFIRGLQVYQESYLVGSKIPLIARSDSPHFISVGRGISGIGCAVGVIAIGWVLAIAGIHDLWSLWFKWR